MADVYEQNLASKSTLTTSDYIRVVGSDNVSYKQLVSDVAKKIIETYAGSTLAGSAQSVQSAINALNSKWPVITVSSGSSKTFTLTNNTRAMLLCSSTYEGGTGIINLNCSSGGVAGASKVASASSITISNSDNTVTLTSTYHSYIMIIPINGTVTAS